MPSFIHQLAKFIDANYENYSQLTVVLPSQRAQKYLQQALFQIHNKPVFSPNFLTIDNFVKQLVDVQSVDSVDLLFRFYKIFQQLGHQEDFETFLNWAPMLIADCNEIDRYMVDSNQLFRNLRDVKEIENWSFGEGRELSENQRQFLDFWENLKDYYTEINTSLDKEGLAYSGAIFRKAVELLFVNIDLKFPNQKFIFAGFNALSEAEIQLISGLVKMGRAEILGEADLFYLNNLNHEAGAFIRSTKLRIPELKLITTDILSNDSKDIRIIECAQAGSMLKVTQDILAKYNENDLSDTLLLLADESLIVPAIKHLPKSVGAANITLGLPLKLTALRSWLELVFEFQNNFSYFKTDALYHKTILSFFRHPFVARFMEDTDLALVVEEERKIIRFNKIFTTFDKIQFSDRVQTCLNLVFQPWKGDFKNAIVKILELNQLVFDQLDAQVDLIERSALFHFHASIKSLQAVFDTSYVPEMNLKSFEKFFNMRWMRETVAYYGNPIEGLQVMGLLETRMLEFKNLIVVGLNEGVMPPRNNINSLIPFDIRRFFGLPLPSEKDALFAHHFYRLITYAEKVDILYATNQGDDMSAAEASRYIQQIELELVEQNKNIRFTKSSFNLPIHSSIEALRFHNNDDVRSRLLDYFQHGLSPSSVNKFIACPLDFYFRYVLQYADDEDVDESVEAREFGNVVHAVLEKLYTPFVGETRAITESDILQMLKIYEFEVEQKFKDVFASDLDLFDRGAMYFSILAAKKQVQRFLRSELKLIMENPNELLFIVALESKLSHTVSFEYAGEQRVLKFSGVIDRIDRFGSSLRIIDYKTGACEAKDVTIKRKLLQSIDGIINADDSMSLDFNDDLDGFGAKHVLQLLFYVMLYHANTDQFPDEVGIISLRNVSQGLQNLNMSAPEKGKVPEVEIFMDKKLAEFTELYFKNMAMHILETDYFEHNPKAKYCLACTN